MLDTGRVDRSAALRRHRRSQLGTQNTCGRGYSMVRRIGRRVDVSVAAGFRCGEVGRGAGTARGWLAIATFLALRLPERVEPSRRVRRLKVRRPCAITLWYVLCCGGNTLAPDPELSFLRAGWSASGRGTGRRRDRGRATDRWLRCRRACRRYSCDGRGLGRRLGCPDNDRPRFPSPLAWQVALR